MPTVKEGQYIRLPGSDIRKGMLVLNSGQILRPPELGLLATVGCVTDIQIKARKTKHSIKIGVLSSGNELVAATTEDLPAGKIRDSNKCMLMAIASQMPFI